MQTLDDNAISVYRAVERYWQEFGFSPSFRDIGRECYFTAAGVMHCLHRLERQGYISYMPRKARSIRILKPLPETPDTTGAIYAYLCKSSCSRLPPTQYELARVFRLSEQTIRAHLNRLEQAGCIQRRKRVTRGVILSPTKDYP